ncbi:unnamed protein product [Linum trigynum]|uniref:Uncharacterized protein n=1 Tax=Linum trigynum TaxID=586398 RepID=A0AAV2DU63_9ROSI
MAVETAMVVILDHHNPHEPAADCGFSAFFDEEEEEQLLLEALDAELAQELQFQEALRASLIISSSDSSPAAAADETETAPSSPTAPPAENQIPSGPYPDFQAGVKREAGESSLFFCEICRERKEDHQVVRNVYDENGGCSCVCFDCINVNAGGERVNNGYYEKKGKTKKLNKKKTVANPNYNKDHRSGASSNRRHFPANRPPPPRVSSPSVYEVELKEKLRMAKEETRVLRDKIQLQHQESKEAMDFQEQFFKEQIKSILEGRVDDYDGGKEEKKKEEVAADCNSVEPEPESLPTKHLNKGMQRIMEEIQKMRINKWEAADHKSFQC